MIYVMVYIALATILAALGIRQAQRYHHRRVIARRLEAVCKRAH